jgi:hypothetical protein
MGVYGYYKITNIIHNSKGFFLNFYNKAQLKKTASFHSH